MRRFLCSLIFSIGLLFSACTSSQPETQEQPSADQAVVYEKTLPNWVEDEVEDTEIETSELSYMNGKPGVKGFVARPKGKTNTPALILIHEFWGLNDDIRENARRFASLGYTALAVDLYEGKVTTTEDEARALAASVFENIAPALQNLLAAVDYLKNSENVDDTRIGSVGWGFGGDFSYELAKNNIGLKTSVIYYGRFHAEDNLRQMKTMLLGHFGEKDVNISIDSVKQFEVKLKAVSGDHEIYMYPDASDGFVNEDNDNYDDDAAETAWQRTIDFLTKHL